jgi:hypothetical protein
MEAGQEIIVSYIQSISPRGLMIAYEDHEVIQRWWKISQEDLEKILLVLSEILPAYFEKGKGRNCRLKNIERRVSQELLQ